MNRVAFHRLLRWNLRSSLRWWWPVAAGALFSFIGWRSALQAAEYASSAQAQVTANVWDAFLMSFAGPGVWDNSLVRMLAWFVPHLLFFYLIGDLANGELLQRGYAVVPLIGSRLRWWWGKVATLLLLTLGYTALSLLAVLAGSMARLPWSRQLSTLLSSGVLWPMPEGMDVGVLLGWTFLLLGSTLFAMASVQIVLSMLWHRSFHAFAAISAIALSSWLLGIDKPHLVRWLPGSQSMLLRHTFLDSNVPGFSLAWSLFYNAVLALLAIGLGTWYVRRIDIFGESQDIR